MPWVGHVARMKWIHKQIWPENEEERHYLCTPRITRKLSKCTDWAKQRTKRATETVSTTGRFVSTGLWKTTHMNSPTTVLWNPVVRYEVRHNTLHCCRVSLRSTDTILLDCVWNVMAYAQKPDFVFRRNGQVHLKRQGRQFSRLLAAELCASEVVMLDTPCSDVVWRVLATHSIRQFPLQFPSRASPCAIIFQLHSTSVYHHFSTVVCLPQEGEVSGKKLSQATSKNKILVCFREEAYLQ